MQQRVRDVHVNPDVRRYVSQVTRATREHKAVDLGVSPAWHAGAVPASQALAALARPRLRHPQRRAAPLPAVLTHRVHISPQVRLRGRTPAEVIAEVIAAVPVPVAE